LSIRRATLLLAAAGSLAACADAGPTGTDSERNEVAGAVGAAEDAGLTEGAWQSTGGDRPDSFAFRAPGGELLFSIGCDVRGGLLFERHGLVTRADLGMMQLRTGGAVRRLATSDADDPPRVVARAPYNDRLILALIRFEGPLEVRFEGLETLMLPPSPAVRELTQGCQRGSRPATVPAEADKDSVL
jgi:hypothetical protein